MSTHTDGASPSVSSTGWDGTGGPDGADGGHGGAGDDGTAGDGDRDGVSDPDPGPPRPRRPAPPPGNGAPPGDAAPDRPLPRRAGHGANGDGGVDSGWLQEEIRRRVAERGTGETGRHSRNDRLPSASAAAVAPGPAAPGDGGAPGGELADGAAPGSDGSGPPAPPPAPRPVAERATPRRPRSTRVPDPYAPDGMRDPGADGAGFTPEQPYRMPGPAAAAPEAGGPGTARPDVADGQAKQWPPADGAAGLPRRVPGAGWTLDRRLLGDDASAPAGNGGAPAPSDVDSDTRMVPALWTAAGADAGPPTADLGIRVGDVADTDDDEDDDGDDGDDVEDPDDLDDDGPTGLATGDTEVIWRAPGLDEPPAPAPTPLPTDPAPYTGARPRGYAATAVEPEAAEREPCPALDDAPSQGRKRVVLSERRAVAHSVRAVVDVQDPGPVGTMFRSRLVGTQLFVALRVGGVALIGLALLPALFAAVPAIGQVSVLGLPLPWILLGLLAYPFLLGLAWWYVGSAERIEQDFVQEVQDR